MYKIAAVITLTAIAVFSLLKLLSLGGVEPLVIQTVTAEYQEASSSVKSYPLDFTRNSWKLYYRLTPQFKQGRVDIALYDDQGKHLNTQGAAGWFTNYFDCKGVKFAKDKSFRIDVIEKEVIGSYKFEVIQGAPVPFMRWAQHFMLFAASLTSMLALTVLIWWSMTRKNSTEVQKPLLPVL